MKHTATLCLALGALTAAPTVFATETNNPFFNIPGSSTSSSPANRLNRALQALQADQSMRAMARGDSDHALIPSQNVTNGGLDTVKFQHYYRGLEVVGSMAFHHDGGIDEVRNRINHFDLNTEPKITADEALGIARSLQKNEYLQAMPELKILPRQDESSAQLVYYVNFKGHTAESGHRVIINAENGKVIANMASHETIAPVQVYSAKDKGLRVNLIVSNGADGKPAISGCKAVKMDTGVSKTLTTAQCKMVLSGQTTLTDNQCQVIEVFPADANFPEEGDPAGLTPSLCTKVVTNGVVSAKADATATRAAANSTQALNYYMTHHNRNGFDDKGGAVISVVHAGIGFGNAFWSVQDKMMAYGDGDQDLNDMTMGVDVAGHELTHAVTSETAKLDMMDEAGALNEANSDIFGKFIEGKSLWRMGADLFKVQGPDAAIRDLANPASLQATYGFDEATGKPLKKAYPVKLSQAFKISADETCGGDNDNCNVHTNSTIASHASYLITQAIGADKSEKISYLVLTHLMNPSETFKSFGKDMRTACKQLFGATSADCVSVDKQLTSVEL